ncbi:EAL domain-containing protein [Photobacterium japonica]|uniref:putative bifunctional diguanylate cyclase/phosphodiesterase n=1 Tax=Photobacterium japonica TaxID=2910235 RepID=UPI003D10386F
MKKALLRFLILLITLLLAALAGTFYIYNEDAQQLKRSIQAREHSRHQSSLHITQHQFTPVLTGLRYLTNKVRNTSQMRMTQKEQYRHLIDIFTQIATARDNFEQISLYNHTGALIIQVNNPNNIAAHHIAQPTPPTAQGSPFNHRMIPDIKHALSSLPERIYTSAFQLYDDNTPGDPIPMIRFISHFKVQGESWLLAVNYRGQDYLDKLMNLYGQPEAKSNIQTWLINNQGHWLLGPDAQESPTFMPAHFDNNVAEFNDAYAMLWADVQKKHNGQIQVDDYLYTYSRFFSKPTPPHDQLRTLPFEGSDLPWTIITRVNMHDTLIEQAYSQQRIIKFTTFTILIMSLIAGVMVFAWHLFQSLKAQKKLYVKVNDTALKYATVLKHVPNGLLTMDKHRRILSINDAAKQILSCDEKDYTLPQPLEALIKSPQVRKQINALIAQFCTTESTNGHVIKQQIDIHTFKTRHIEVIATKTSYSSSSEILVNLRDVTEWIERENKLKSMSWALEQSQDAILITNEKGIIEYVNPSFERYNNVSAESIIGTQSALLLRKSLPSVKEIRSVQQQLKQGTVIQRVIAHRVSDADSWYEEKTISPIVNHLGKISHYLSTGKDITERVLAENRLHKMAHYDYLTDLPNRMLLQQQIEKAIEACQHTRKHIALMILDLDHFKQINDSLGRDTGDIVIQAVAKRIQHALRNHDFLAHLGGDEFAILITRSVTPDNIATLAARLLKTLSAPLCILKREFFLTASLGISLVPDDTDNLENLNKYTEIALYQAKGEGRNQFCFYTREMGIETAKQLHLESSLRQSLGTTQYELYYQPKVDASTHNICGVEALLRWHDDAGEIQSPMEVIPVLERSGLIVEAGEHMIKQACEQLAQWQRKGLYLNFALNLSARQLLNSGIVDAVQQAISASGCNPSYLELEITESVIMTDVETALDKLIKLEALGIKIAIDDFGTGYSSLAYLSRFPTHILKIDREFVKDLPWNKDNIAITRSIVELAHNLNMRVVAEGVEYDTQEQFLSDIGVEEFQGFLFGRPVPIPHFEKLYLNANADPVF